MNKKIVVDFQILDTKDPNVLVIIDTSEWQHAEDKPATLFIKLPSSDEELHYRFVKGKTVVFNSHNLGVSCISGDCSEQNFMKLPDGLYKIRLQSGYEGISKERLYLRDHRFQMRFYNAILKLGPYTSLEDCQIEIINNIQYTMLRAQAYVSEGNAKEGIKFFQEARALLDKLSRCCDK